MLDASNQAAAPIKYAMKRFDMSHHTASYYEGLEKRLNELRSLIASSQRGIKYVELFDEFMREKEYGLALDTFCDFVLEPDSTSFTDDLAHELISLHIAMEIDDECLLKLKRRMAHPSSTDNISR